MNYHIVESLETELATADRTHATPDGIQQQSGLCTGMAWDNYDANAETLTGSGTLHYTFGICYQNIASNEVEDNDMVSKQDSVVMKPHLAKHKRAFHSRDSAMEPYMTKQR